jgi:hypothetical protein
VKNKKNKNLSAAEAAKNIHKLSQRQVEEIRETFRDRIIRRSPSSLKWDGTPLLDLPEVQDHSCFVTLKGVEHAELDKVQDKALK